MIFDHAIKNPEFYNDDIRQKVQEGKSGEELFFELAMEELTQAADLLRPFYDGTDRVDGWVSSGKLPLLAYDTARSIKEASFMRERSDLTSSSRFLTPLKDFRPSRRRLLVGQPSPGE